MEVLNRLIQRYPSLDICKKEIIDSFDMLKDAFVLGNKLMIYGNGGSFSDSQHIVGELMKSFKKKRICDLELKEKLRKVDDCHGLELFNSLQKTLPCIALGENNALNSAFSNDVVNGDLYLPAQQILGLGKEGDVFLAISTSGNSRNLYYAMLLCKAIGIKVILLTGNDGGLLKKYSDISIIVPEKETYLIQEMHLPIYHCLCSMLEDYFFDKVF